MPDSSATVRPVTARRAWWVTCLAALLIIFGGCLAFPGAVLIGWARRLSPELREKIDDRVAPLVARFQERRR